MTYFIKTFGCQMNTSDSERIAGFLEMKKITPAKDISEAGLAIFNTCGIRQTAEDRVYGRVHKLRKNNSKIKIILTGCLANRKDVQKKLKNKVDFFFSINDFFKFENWLIKNYLPAGRQGLEIENWKLKIPAQKNLLTQENISYLSISPQYTEKYQAFVPIMTGCDNFCSYCVVPYARGKEISRPILEIISEIETLKKNGYKEITLLGQNVNSYNHTVENPEIENWELGKKIKLKVKKSTIISFPELLKILSDTYPNIFFRFLTSHPKDFSEELMQVIAKNKNISREIHLPLQSGSDKILRAMNRPYTQKHYLDLIKKAQKIIPRVSFTTDIIVGFPRETEKDFLETVSVFQKVKYQEAYINKYSPRPGTSAIKFNDSVSWEEKKHREKFLREILQKQQKK